MMSIEEYVQNMQEGQEKIYFVCNPSYQGAVDSPYMEPFKDSKIDVLILSSQIDEVLFSQSGDWKGKKYCNIEGNFEEISKDLGKQPESESLVRNRLPEEDITSFCLWIKNELKDRIGKVTISKRLRDTPAIITGDVSSSMRVMM